jgi:hypothetical protein
MSAVERDPAGLLARVPELGALASSHPTLRRAIERGRPHAVYRALFWLRLLGKAGADAPLIGQLLSNRRLFIQPLNGAPSMVTLNGFGAKAYGSAEADPADGTYLVTLYFVAIFVPIYPFSAYLVRPAEKGWTFFGKVPLSTTGYLWQRAIALAGVVAVLFGVVNAVGAMRYNTVQLVNGLSAPVEVQVGLAPPVTVASNQVEKVRSKVGQQDVVVKLRGKEIERGQLLVKRGYDVNAWNVLGAGALFHADVVYTAKDSSSSAPESKEPVILCGERAVLQDDIDYPFSTPPESMKMGKREQAAHRSHFGLAEVKSPFCVFQLATTGKLAQAKSLAQRLAEAENYDLALIGRLAALFNDRNEPSLVSELLTNGRQRHDDQIEYHRLYQGQAILEGRRKQVVAEYRERARLQPDSADTAYLLGRVLTGAEADRFVSDSQRRFPGHAYLLRSAAYRALWRGEFAEVERLVEQLRSVDASLWQDSVELELRALAAQGKVEQARALAGECLKSPRLDSSNRFELVVNSALLARFAPKPATASYLDALKGDSSRETSELRIGARVNGCESLTAIDLAWLEDKDLKAQLELELLARSDPKAALGRVVSGDDRRLGITAAAWALLLTEAARLDEHHPALPRLMRWSPTGKPGAAALIQYAQSSTLSEELEDISPEMLAAADFVHSRALPASSAEGRALRTRAAREDMLRGPVSVAMTTWSL